jgi:hypothetical protein
LMFESFPTGWDDCIDLTAAALTQARKRGSVRRGWAAEGIAAVVGPDEPEALIACDLAADRTAAVLVDRETGDTESFVELPGNWR